MRLQRSAYEMKMVGVARLRTRREVLGAFLFETRSPMRLLLFLAAHAAGCLPTNRFAITEGRYHPHYQILSIACGRSDKIAEGDSPEVPLQ